MEIIVDAFLDALIDGVKMLPFLYLAYLLIEWLERNHGAVSYTHLRAHET